MQVTTHDDRSGSGTDGTATGPEAPRTPADLAVRLYRQHGRGLFAYARALTGRRETAEDIVQEAFLRFLEAGRDPGSRGAVGFLYGIARNLALDMGRKTALRKRHEAGVARSLVERRGGAQAGLDRPERDPLAELENLPLEQREVVILKVVGGLTFEEIGGLLGLPWATAASRYRYALGKLSARLSSGEERP